MDRRPPVIRTTGWPAHRHLVRYWMTTSRTTGRPTDPSSGPLAHCLLVRPFNSVDLYHMQPADTLFYA